MSAVLWRSLVITSGIANSSWLLDVEHVGLVIPCIIVPCVFCGTCLKNIGSSFLEKSEHGRAARATVEPYNKRSFCKFSRISLKEHVMDVLGSASDWKEPRVDLEGRGSRPAWQSIQGRDEVVSGSPVSRCRTHQHENDG